jgi:hypothetical protein
MQVERFLLAAGQFRRQMLFGIEVTARKNESGDASLITAFLRSRLTAVSSSEFLVKSSNMRSSLFIFC